MHQLRKKNPGRFNALRTDFALSSEDDLLSSLEIFFMRIEIQMVQVLNPRLSRECAVGFKHETSGEVGCLGCPSAVPPLPLRCPSTAILPPFCSPRILAWC